MKPGRKGFERGTVTVGSPGGAVPGLPRAKLATFQGRAATLGSVRRK